MVDGYRKSAVVINEFCNSFENLFTSSTEEKGQKNIF